MHHSHIGVFIIFIPKLISLAVNSIAALESEPVVPSTEIFQLATFPWQPGYLRYQDLDKNTQQKSSDPEVTVQGGHASIAALLRSLCNVKDEHRS